MKFFINYLSLLFIQQIFTSFTCLMPICYSSNLHLNPAMDHPFEFKVAILNFICKSINFQHTSHWNQHHSTKKPLHLSKFKLILVSIYCNESILQNKFLLTAYRMNNIISDSFQPKSHFEKSIFILFTFSDLSIIY